MRILILRDKHSGLLVTRHYDPKDDGLEPICCLELPVLEGRMSADNPVFQCMLREAFMAGVKWKDRNSEKDVR